MNTDEDPISNQNWNGSILDIYIWIHYYTCTSLYLW